MALTPTRPDRRSRREQEIRGRILEAAIACFLEKGFETTIDLDRGIAELVRAAKLIEFQNPFANV